MNVSNRRTLRTLAIATLVTFGGASLCLLLTFPHVRPAQRL